MEKLNATILNIIMVVMTAVMGLAGYIIPSRAVGTSIGVLLAVIVAVIAYFILRNAKINERGYYIFGSFSKDAAVSAVEFVLVLGMMTFLGVSGKVSPDVAAWETVLVIAFCAMLFYGIEKKRLRDDMIAEIEEEQKREAMENEENEK